MSFMSDYMLYNSGNEANPNYHMWAGLSALSSIVSRRVWIDMGYFRIYPNLYVVLLGPPGNGKTTAMSTAKGLIRFLGMENIPYSAECQTKESLVLELSNYEKRFILPEPEKPYVYTPISIFVTELSQFIGVDPARMIDFLTTVFDQDFYDLKTKNKGSQLIVGPFVTMCACTTPEWITSYLKMDVITGGFSRRALFVLEDANTNKRIAFPVITPEMQAAWERMIEHAHKLFCICGPITWAPEAREFYKNWYETRTISTDPLIQWFDKTSFIQILKVAMLLGLSESPPSRVMKLEYLNLAMDLINLMKQNLPKVFMGLGRNEMNQARMRIINVLNICGGILTEKSLFARVYQDLPRGGSQMEFNNLLSDMEKCDDIRRVQAKKEDGSLGAVQICTMQYYKEKVKGEQK